MTRLQATLVLILATLTLTVFGRATWAGLAPTVAAAPALVGSVPAWAWWTVFGVAMGTMKLFFFHRNGSSCGSCASASAPSAS
ncbi:MAG: hypothetical protein AAGI91_13555 [Bacteroidota bacterium]